MGLDAKKMATYGLTVSGMITAVSLTKKQKPMLTVLAGSETVKVICDTNTKLVSEDYHAKVNAFAAGDSVMFMQKELLG